VSDDSGGDSQLLLELGCASDLGPVVSLLGASGLPTADVEQHLERFILARWHGELVGVVGAEIYGEVGLLRSLCIVESKRGRGTGRSLLSALDAIIGTRGVRDVYLLTTTAARFFERAGFAPIPRDEAPLAIRQTTEFRSLCPASATLMRKEIAPLARHVSRPLLRLREDIPGARMWQVRMQQTMMTYFEVDAGVRFETHSHEGEQITTVLEGELFFEFAEELIRVGPGDAIAVPPHVAHAVFTTKHPARAFDSWSPPFPR
jgi:amino-acid N-acetyltransferase